jgi:hypothetical protein
MDNTRPRREYDQKKDQFAPLGIGKKKLHRIARHVTAPYHGILLLD